MNDELAVTPSTGWDSSLGEEFEELRREYIARQPVQVATIHAQVCDLLGSPWDRERAVTLHRAAHTLVGSAGSFGFGAITTAARAIEHLVKAMLTQDQPLVDQQRAELRILLGNLEHQLAVTQPAPPDQAPLLRVVTAAPAPPQVERRVVLLAEDVDLERDLTAQLGFYGYATQSIVAGEDLDAALGGLAPAALIVETVAPGALLADGPSAAAARRARELGIALVCISSRGDVAARLEAVGAGATGYFTRPLATGSLVDWLDRVTTPPATEPYRVLIVEDDQQLAAWYALCLEQAGMASVVVTDPLQVMHALADFVPDLMLVDLYMPACSGLDLAAVIRQQEALVSIPIVFLSAETNLHTQLAALRLGGDDFLTKPIQPDHLISSVTSRVQRSRVLRSFMVRDSLTGLLNHTRTKEQLDVELARARRQHSPLALAMIDIDRFKAVNDTHGHPTGDRVIKSLARLLQQRLRKTDTAGRYGGEEFAVILPDTPGALAHKVLDEVCAGFSQIRQQADSAEFRVTFSCGIASFPVHQDATSLMRAADEVLYAAKRHGRNQVVLADQRS